MKKILRTTSGVLGIFLLMLAGTLSWVRRGPEPTWRLMELDNLQGGRLAWVSLTDGAVTTISPTIPNIAFLTTSPNEHWLYFTESNGHCSTPCYGLYRMRWDGAGLRRIADMRSSHEMYLSPDGAWMAYRNQLGNLILARSNGTDPRSITTKLPQGYTDDLGVIFSPDSQEVVIAVRDANRRLYSLYRVAGNDTDLSVQNISYVTDLSVSPLWWWSDEWILVEVEGGGTRKVYRMHPDGSELTSLTDAPYEQLVNWLPAEGLLIIYSGDVNQLIAVRPADWTVAWTIPLEGYWFSNTTPRWLVTFDGTDWRARRPAGTAGLLIPLPPDMNQVWEVWGENGDWLWLTYDNHDTAERELWRLHLQNQAFEKLWATEGGLPTFLGWMGEGARWSNTPYASQPDLPTTTLYSMNPNGQTLTTVTTQVGEVVDATLNTTADFSRVGLFIVGAFLLGGYGIKRKA